MKLVVVGAKLVVVLLDYPSAFDRSRPNICSIPDLTLVLADDLKSLEGLRAA